MKEKISRREKVSYALANIGNIPVMTLINSYLLVFYTNVCGINPAACATLFLIARIMDGLNDPFVGYVIDHLPNTKMGHFRPPLIAGTILVSINFMMLWFGPMMAPTGKLAIAYVSYILLGFLFPVMDISLNSLLPVMTTDMEERNKLSAIKGLIYALGAVVIAIVGPLVLGNVNNRSGYIFLVIGTIVIVLVCSIVGTLGVKERVRPRKNAQKYNVKDLFRFFAQKPVYITFLTILMFSISKNIISAANTYFFTYVMGNLKMSAVMSLVISATLLPTTMLISKLVDKYGKKRIYMTGFLINALIPLIRLLDVRNVVLLVIASLFNGIGTGCISPLNYSIQADNTDYIELETGMRAEGAISSLSSFISKCAMGIGGSIPGYLLALAGYNSALEVQNSNVITAIIFCVIVIPACTYLIGAAIFGLNYPLTREKLVEMHNTLEARHAERDGLSK